jgi:hypothetical protein
LNIFFFVLFSFFVFLSFRLLILSSFFLGIQLLVVLHGKALVRIIFFDSFSFLSFSCTNFVLLFLGFLVLCCSSRKGMCLKFFVSCFRVSFYIPLLILSFSFLLGLGSLRLFYGKVCDLKFFVSFFRVSFYILLLFINFLFLF